MPRPRPATPDSPTLYADDVAACRTRDAASNRAYQPAIVAHSPPALGGSFFSSPGGWKPVGAAHGPEGPRWGIALFKSKLTPRLPALRRHDTDVSEYYT
jgi:hypothetical protein